MPGEWWREGVLDIEVMPRVILCEAPMHSFSTRHRIRLREYDVVIVYLAVMSDK
jgi:hypothetical protein